MKALARLALGILALVVSCSVAAAGEDPAALLKAGQWRQAEAAYGALLEGNPDDAAAVLGRAQAREKLRDIAGAERDYARAVELAPKSVEAWLRRAAFHEQHADDGRVVLADYNAVVELAPKNARVYTLRGDFLVRVKLFKEALVDAEKAVALKPDQAAAHLLRAQALEGLGLHESATVSFHQALQLDPKNEKAKQGLTRMLAATGGPAQTDLTPLSEQVTAKAREYDAKDKKAEETGLDAGRLYNPDQDPTVKARAIAAREEAQAREAAKSPQANRPSAPAGAATPAAPKPAAKPKTGTPPPVAATKPPSVAAAPARPTELSARLRRATVLSVGTNGLFSETTRREDIDALGLETQKAMLLGLCQHQLHLPLAWAGDEFYYAGPALDYGFGGRRPGEFYLWGRLGPDGEAIAQLRFLWDRGEGSRLAFELVDLPVTAGTDLDDMRDLSLSMRHAGYCTGPELFQHVKRYANTRSPTNATRVENGQYVHADNEPTVLEYRPTEFSFGWFRSAKLSGDQLASRRSLAEVKQRLDRTFAEGSGWAHVVAVPDELLVRLYPTRAAKRAAGGALEVQTGPNGKTELAADGMDRIRIKARVRTPAGQTQADETGKIEFAADGEGVAWLDLTRAGESLEDGWKVIEAGASNPDSVRQGGATPPTHFEVKVTARSQGKVLTRQLKIPAAAPAAIDAKPDLVELSAQSGERAKVRVAIENAGPDPWSFRAEYAAKARALARTEIRPLNRDSAELTLQEAGLDPAHDGSNTEVSVLRLLAEQPGKPTLERDIKVVVAQEGLFVAKTGLDPMTAQYLVKGDGSGATTEIDFRVFAKNPRTGKVENLTRLPGTLSSVRVESLEVKGTLAANVMEACRFRAEVRDTPRALNEPCGVLRLSLEKEVPGDGRTIPCDLKLTFVDRNEAVFSAIVSVGLVPSQEGPGSPDWKVELGRCEEVIRKFVPAAYAPKMRALLDKQKTKLGVEGLRLLRHKIWMAAAELTLGEGGRGYDDEAKWANRIAETLDWAQWAGDMAFGAVVASWGGPYAAEGAGVVKTLLISAINAYQDGQTPEQWLWENACSVPGYLEGKAIDPGTFEKLGMEKKVKIWGLYVAYHFFKNLYTERSVVQALKNVAANVGNNVLSGWLGDEVAKHGGRNARTWAGEKAQEAKTGAAAALTRITTPAAPAPKAVGSSTQNENAQAKPAYRPDAVAKAKPQPDRFAEAQKNRAIQDAKPLTDDSTVFGDPAATPAPSATLPRADGAESDSSALIRTRAVVGPDGKPYAHPDDVSRVMQDPSMVRALGGAEPAVRDAFENTRQTLYRQHDAIVVGHVKEAVPGMKNRTVRVLEYRTPGKAADSFNTDRDYRVCYYDGVDAQGREIWVEVDRRKWEAASYLAFAKLTGGPTGSEAEVRAWAAKHQQVATDKSHIEASRDYSDQRVIADPETRIAKTVSVRSNVERIREFVKDGQVRSTTLEDAQALGGMFEVKVGDAHFEHEAFVQANKAVDVFVDLRKAYNLEGRNIGQVPDKVLKGIEIVRQANGKLREDPNRRDPAALAAANKELRKLGYADLGDFMRKLGGQFESLKTMRQPE